MPNSRIKKLKEKTANRGFAEMEISTDPIDLMTSREFQNDTRAHIDNIMDSLKDNVMLQHYETAIKYNKHLFRDKVVLNVGCGIGILALFAVKAGAKHVYAVDRSNVVDYAERITRVNGYAHKITFIKGCIKSIALPVQKVDIILCDWLGYSVLFQSLCDAVIFARDKWLITDGVILPDKATLYMGAFTDENKRWQRIDWWQNVYGFNMNCIREVVVTEPSFYRIKTSQIITNVQNIKTFDMNKATVSDLKVHSRFMLKVNCCSHIDGIFSYADIEFTKSHTPFSFSTSPWAPVTYLVQTVLYFDRVLTVNENDAFFGGIEIRKANDNGDWNDVQVAMQFFSGEPQCMNLEVDMLWHLRQYGQNLHNFVTTKEHEASLNDNSNTACPSSTLNNSNRGTDDFNLNCDVPAKSKNTPKNHHQNGFTNKKCAKEIELKNKRQLKLLAKINLK